MALMSDLVNDVTAELRFGSGVGVQIHLEDSISRNISRCYRTLMKKYIWRDYHIVTPLIIDATTGQPTTSLTGILTNYSNIIAVFPENDTNPFQFAPVVSNPTLLRRPSLVHSGGAGVFTVYPKGKIRNIILISRVYQETDFDLTDDVPFYRDILALCAAGQLSVKAGTNEQLTKHLLEQYNDLLSVYVMDELQDVYQLNTHRGVYPTDWWTND